MKTIKTVVITIIVVALVGGAFVLGRKTESKPNIDMIIEECGFNNIGELDTAEFYFTMVENYEGDPKKLFDLTIPFTTPKFTYSVDGYVKAGIDFTSIKLELSNDVILVTMPKPKVMVTKLDLSTMKVFEESKGLFNSIRADDRTAAEMQLEQRAESLAVEKGILNKAAQNAEVVVGNMLSQVVGIDYTIRFR